MLTDTRLSTCFNPCVFTTAALTLSASQAGVGGVILLLLYVVRKILRAKHLEAAAEREHAAQIAAVQQEGVERVAATRSRFLKWVCHEIRNPITGVMGSLDVLLLRSGSDGALSARQLELVSNARACADAITRVRCCRRAPLSH